MKTLLLLAAVVATALPAAQAANYKLIHAFAGGKSDGRTPTIESSLTPSGADLYGATLDGGQFTNGVVFEIATNGGAINLLHTFNGWSVLNQNGSKADGAYPVGTPVLGGSTLYGMTQSGGSNGPGFGVGTIYSVNPDRTGFQVLHSFGALNDGFSPQGSLILAGSTLFGMTSAGGTNGISQGIVFSMETNGSNYQILHSFINDGGAPQGSLILWGTTLYGMTAGEVFRVETNGGQFLRVHQFTGSVNDGGSALGSLTRSGPYLYGMTSAGGANGVGTIFQLYLIGSQFQILHSFAYTEAWAPRGDLVLSGPTLYGMSYGGVTNQGRIGAVGSGAVFQINTNGTDYQVIHTFEFPLVPNDGSLPFGTPLVVGSELYGMTSLGGSSADGGCIFSLALTPTSTATAPVITNTSPLPSGDIDVAYRQQLGATGGEAPYTWALSSGQLPKGLTLSASGLISGKPSVGALANFSVKVTGHDKLTSTQSFSLTIKAPPKIAITTPKQNLKVTTPTFTVGGTASSAVGLAGVYFQLNGGSWTKAQSSDSFAVWTCPNLPLRADTNVFRAYAEDLDGNDSTTNTVSFTYYVTAILTVATNGNGSFTPHDNGAKLQVGATFPIKAAPAKGFVFTNWTDGSGHVLSQVTTLKFVMASNLTLIANFVPAPKPAMADLLAGNYHGLFAPSQLPPQNSNSGALRLTLAASGFFSGQLQLGLATLPFSGQFDSSGAAYISIDKGIENPVVIALQLDTEHQALLGEVTGNNLVAPLQAYRNGFDATHPATNYAGKSAVDLLVETTPDLSIGKSNSPHSTATVTVTALGNVTFVATLPDGTSISQTSELSRDGYWPLYISLPGNHGLIWSWHRVTDNTGHPLP